MKYSVLLWLLVLAYVPIGAQKAQCWNIFRGDQALSGQSQWKLPEDPELLWSYQAGDEIRSSPVSCENLIVTGSGNGFVYCLDEKGQFQWKFETGNMIEAPALILDGIVYIGNMDGALYAIDLYTGKEVWKYQGGPKTVRQVFWWDHMIFISIVWMPERERTGGNTNLTISLTEQLPVQMGRLYSEAVTDSCTL